MSAETDILHILQALCAKLKKHHDIQYTPEQLFVVCTPPRQDYELGLLVSPMDETDDFKVFVYLNRGYSDVIAYLEKESDSQGPEETRTHTMTALGITSSSCTQQQICDFFVQPPASITHTMLFEDGIPMCFEASTTLIAYEATD